MVNYESIFIVNSKIGEDAVKAVVEKFKEIFEKSTKVEKIDEWGKRKLAYPIDKVEEGYYVLVNFEAEPSFPQELERVYKITEGIIKYLVIKK
jgi:small subunit ribosomal protein S6